MKKMINFDDETIPMQIISISIPEAILKILNKIVSSGCVPSRSELVRTMILQNLSGYKKLIDTFQILTDDQLKVIK